MVFTHFVSAQSILTTNPPWLNFDARPGFAELQLINEGDTINWIATIEGDWLTMEPLNGKGSTDLFIEYADNPGPRRTARIVFEDQEGVADPYTLEIRQFQGMPTGMMPVVFIILEFTHTDPLLLPYTARASFNYLPREEPLFFSLLLRTDERSDTVWVIQNLLLPEAFWHDSIQPISARFDLGLLGFEHGQPVETLQYAYTLSTEPDTIPPVVPEFSFLNAEIKPSVVRATGHLPGMTGLMKWLP